MGDAATTRWDNFAHDADIGVVSEGPTKDEAFRQAAIALTAVVVDPRSVRLTDAIALQCEGSTDELRFVQWLNAVVYE